MVLARHPTTSTWPLQAPCCSWIFKQLLQEPPFICSELQEYIPHCWLLDRPLRSTSVISGLDDRHSVQWGIFFFQIWIRLWQAETLSYGLQQFRLSRENRLSFPLIALASAKPQVWLIFAWTPSSRAVYRRSLCSWWPSPARGVLWLPAVGAWGVRKRGKLLLRAQPEWSHRGLLLCWDCLGW